MDKPARTPSAMCSTVTVFVAATNRTVPAGRPAFSSADRIFVRTDRTPFAIASGLSGSIVLSHESRPLIQRTVLILAEEPRNWQSLTYLRLIDNPMALTMVPL